MIQNPDYYSKNPEIRGRRSFVKGEAYPQFSLSFCYPPPRCRQVVIDDIPTPLVHGCETMSLYPPGKASQQCAASFAVTSSHTSGASNTLLLIHPASISLSHQGQPRRRHVRCRPRGSTPVALAITERSPMRQIRHWPRPGSIGEGAGRGGGVGDGAACRALRTAASPTTAEVVDPASTGALECSSDEERGQAGFSGGVGLDAVSAGVSEERAVNGGGIGGKVQQRGSKSGPKLRAQNSPEAALMVTEAKKLSSAASALMRRMTHAGKMGRCVRARAGTRVGQWWRQAATWQ